MPEYESEFMRKKMSGSRKYNGGKDSGIENPQKSGLEALMDNLESSMKIIVGRMGDIQKTIEHAEQKIQEGYDKADDVTKKKYDDYSRMLAGMKQELSMLSSKITPLAENLENELKSIIENYDSMKEVSPKIFSEELPESIRRSADYSKRASEEKRDETIREASELIEKDREEIEKIKRMKKLREENEEKGEKEP